jgi:hypothetical protein
MEAYEAKGLGKLSIREPFTKMVTRDPVTGNLVFATVTGEGMLMPEGDAGPRYLKILAPEGVTLCSASETDPNNINKANCSRVPLGDYISWVDDVLASVESKIFDLEYPDSTNKSFATTFIPLSSASLHEHPTYGSPSPPPTENGDGTGNY